MSVNQARRNLNQINKDIASLEKKLATETKKEADKNKRINDLQKSINKNTSPSIIKSKMRQIQSYRNDVVRIINRKSELNKKIADKKNKLSDATLKLQKEEQLETKKNEKVHSGILESYERRINSLTNQLSKEMSYLVQTNNENVYSNINTEIYDVFVSHASEDKESFVDEFCEILKEFGIKVWYDSLAIKWGDSLRNKIDDGLKNSKYGIVVISPAFIKKGWTQYELDGLFQREMTGGKIVLPVWHDITKKEVESFSPSLAGRKALTTATMTPKEMAKELVQILKLK